MCIPVDRSIVNNDSPAGARIMGAVAHHGTFWVLFPGPGQGFCGSTRLALAGVARAANVTYLTMQVRHGGVSRLGSRPTIVSVLDLVNSECYSTTRCALVDCLMCGTFVLRRAGARVVFAAARGTVHHGGHHARGTG